MKTYAVRIACVYLLAGLSSTAAVPEETLRRTHDPAFDIGLQTWFSSGESQWKIRFREVNPLFGPLEGRSVLEWEEVDSVIYRVHAGYRVLPWLRVAGGAGLGDIDDGRNIDSDWLREGRGEVLFSRSIADTDGDLTLLDLSVEIRLNEFMDLSGIGGTWDILLGFHYYEEALRDRNGIQTIDFEEDIRVPLPGLDSTYDFEWRAFKLGLRGEVPLAQTFRVKGELSALLGVEFRGEGFWNLRSDFRSESPNFVQEASAGAGAELKTSMLYDFTPNLYAEVGLWWMYLRAEDGTDTTFFADGTAGTGALDDVESQRFGLLIGVGGRF